jgi:hypothetical protein
MTAVVGNAFHLEIKLLASALERGEDGWLNIESLVLASGI